MKKLFLLLLVAGGAFAAFRWFERHRANAAYEGFAESWAREKREAAARFGDAETVRRAFEVTPLRKYPGGAAMEAYRGERSSIESRESAPDGGVALTATQTIFFDPPGVTSAIGGAMFARFRHAATVRKTPEGWRVVAFEPAYLEMGELRRR